MFISATLLASFYALFQGAQADRQYPDELVAAMMKTAQEHQHKLSQVHATPNLRSAPQSESFAKESDRVLKDSPKPKPDPKPKPGPYMVFSNHIDDANCGPASLIESHGYVIGNCYTGFDTLAGMYWSFTMTSDVDNIYLNYGFYLDSECATSPIVSSVETLPNGCAARGTSGGHSRTKRFFTSPVIPPFHGGALFNSYETQAKCMSHKPEDIVGWSFLENNMCDPNIHSPIYGAHTTDETRTCRGRDITATLYSTNDMTCSGTATTTTKVTKEWNCAAGSNSGVDAVYLDPVCV